MLLPVRFFNSGLNCRRLHQRLSELVLVVDDNVSLLNPNVHGVFAVVISHPISMASASHLFASAWRHADLNVHAFRSTTVARVITSTRVINLNDLRDGTGVHFAFVDIPHTLKERLWCFVNINCTVKYVSTDCRPEYRTGNGRDRGQVSRTCRASDANGKANAGQLSESFHCLSFRLV
jgi:hypothetical protein